MFVLLLMDNQTISSQIISEGMYQNIRVKYYKNIVVGGLNIDSINSRNYMYRVKNYLTSINAKVDSIYRNSTYSLEEVTYVITTIKLLNDTMDALNYIPLFQSSGFFYYAAPRFYTGDLNMLDPDKFLFKRQKYQFQGSDTNEPYHDADMLRTRYHDGIKNITSVQND
ncbi:MAG: hypothetical protein ABI462_07350 [Ignavibacteria bacterium]